MTGCEPSVSLISGLTAWGVTDEFTPVQPTSLLKLEMLSNLSIRLIAGEPQLAEKFLLEAWAEPVAEDTWRLEPKRARKAVERGLSTAAQVSCPPQSPAYVFTS